MALIFIRKYNLRKNNPLATNSNLLKLIIFKRIVKESLIYFRFGAD